MNYFLRGLLILGVLGILFGCTNQEFKPDKLTLENKEMAKENRKTVSNYKGSLKDVRNAVPFEIKTLSSKSRFKLNPTVFVKDFKHMKGKPKGQTALLVTTEYSDQKENDGVTFEIANFPMFDDMVKSRKYIEIEKNIKGKYDETPKFKVLTWKKDDLYYALQLVDLNENHSISKDEVVKLAKSLQ